MGSTGDARIPSRFAVPGQPGFPEAEFHAFLDDLQALRLHLKPQRRRGYSRLSLIQRLIRTVTGSRTRWSYWHAKLSPGVRTLIWKDPMAALAVPAVLASGIPTVVCMRSPLAHAASFKRKNWQGDIKSIYPNFRSVYGSLPEVERFLAKREELTSVEAASLLWNMIYSLVAGTMKGQFGELPTKLILMSGTALEANEIEVYRRAYNVFGLPFEGYPRRVLESRARQAVQDIGDPRKTHDWSRSVGVTNSYWSTVLTGDEIALVTDLNAEIFTVLEGGPQGPQEHAVRL
jgi:hypothetical protein